MDLKPQGYSGLELKYFFLLKLSSASLLKYQPYQNLSKQQINDAHFAQYYLVEKLKHIYY